MSDRPRAAFALALVGLALALVSACSLVTRLDDDAFGGPLDAGKAPDATNAEASPAGATDAGPDACTARFCDDFERDSVQGAWTSASGSGLAIETAEGHGRVLAVTLDAADNAAAQLTKQVSGSASSIHYAFDVELVRVTGNANFSAIDLPRADGRTAESFFLLTTSGQQLGTQVAALDGGGVPYGGATLAPPIPIGRWTHVELDVELAGAPSITARVDGAPAATHTLSADLVAGPFDVVAGVLYSSNAPASKFLIDNVSLDDDAAPP